MKKLFILLALSCSGNLYAQKTYQLSKIWETDSLAVPESVTPVGDGRQMFVSLIDGTPFDVDGKGGIARITTDGKIINPMWVGGLNAPKGIAVMQNKLYVADLTEVVVIDIPSGKIDLKIKIPEAEGLNDVTVDSKNTVYVSDSKNGIIFSIKNNVATPYITSLKGSNGLKAVGTDLYIGAGPVLWKADANKKLTKIAEGFESSVDGLQLINKDEFLITCWNGLVYSVHSNGKFNKLMDTRGVMNTADIHYDQKKKIVYLPTFFKKSVIAYKLH
ncbi:MAG: ATP-binding protein [Arcticibacter sp.]